MKKIYVLATAAIVALASCTKTEVVSNQEAQEIGFRQFTGSMTKATDLSELEGGPTTMGVFAHINGTNAEYFSNAIFEKPGSGNDWSGNPARYWPLQDALDFTVYAPRVDGTTYADSKLSVTVADNTTTQSDFLYGVERYLNKSKPTAPYVSVPVVLKHALSKVSIQIKSNVENLFKVTKVEIVDPIQNGSFVVDYSSTTAIDVTPGSTKGTVETYSGAEKSLTTTAVDFGSKLVFPISPSTNAAYLRITYNMESATGLVAKTAALPEKWETGKRYIYTVTLSATEILLTPTVEDWTDGTTSEITVEP
ncbi:MAG: fimbrillin family protein [Candidatus Cryptobacteroides sp.]